MSEEAHSKHYIKIWMILLGLLFVSIVGPMVGIMWLTLITAFGIAVVKASMVAKNFMHLTAQPKFVMYIIVSCVILMGCFWAGVAPDVQNQSGTNWVKESTVLVMADDAQGAAGHGDSHGHEEAH